MKTNGSKQANQPDQDAQSNQESHAPIKHDSRATEKPAKQGKALTGKQLHFARCLAQGMSKTDAYIEAYDTDDMARKTINEAACRLSQDSRITARVQQLILLKEKALIRSTVGLKDQVLTKLVHMMDHATPQDSAKLRAAELLGKSIGLFKDVIEDNRHQDMTADQLTALLHEKLSKIATQDSHTVNQDETKH